MGLIVDPFSTTENDFLPDYQLIIREFPSGMIEMVQRRVNFMKELDRSRNQGVRGPVIEKTSEEKEASKEENLRRAERRARQKVRHLVMSIAADHLLTLTYRDLVTDSEKLARDYKEFARLVRQKYPDWQYVAVKEFQERGALHMHCAVVGKQDIKFIRECWYTALGAPANATGDQTPGAVNVRYKKKRFSGQSPVFSALQLAAYLSKYISKTFAHERELGMHRYQASRGIEPPKVMRQYLGAVASIHKENSFPVATTQTLGIADLMGVTDYQIWATPDLDVMVLRGAI
jgi:hypothetical protein